MFDTQKLYNDALAIAKEKECLFVDELVSHLPCSKPTFYEKFPPESYELNAIKDALEINRVNVKTQIRTRLLKSKRASELALLYRMICTPEEHRAINPNVYEVEDGLNSRVTIVINKGANTLENDEIE